MKVDRFYLEIKSLKSLNEAICPIQNLVIEKVNPPNIEINKFFYKNIGKNHRWIDRLVWGNPKWESYIENKNVHTHVLKLNSDLVGYFEIINDDKTKSSEIAYFGILEDYIGKKIGGYFLSEAIKICFKNYCKRIWVHTCTLDHENALKNYLKRGMKVFREETLNLNTN